MQPQSRVVKSQFNMIASLINNIVVTVLGFVTRSVFVHTLGMDYLGLNGLFTNVLSLLSLAELGVGSAITFSLYKPIAEGNQDKIQALIDLYKKAYRIIGWIIFGVGIVLVPFLGYFVNLDAGVDINYHFIYIMFLMNSVVSYWFFAYRSVIIYAHQEGYVLTKIETIFTLLRSVVQFGILLLFKNYYLYLLIPIIMGIGKNIIVSNVAGKKYPYINIKPKYPLAKEEKKDIFRNVYALACFRISSVVYNATDNIIISTFLSTKIVGLLSNFTMIIQLVTSYVNMFFQSMYASVGNLNATESIEYKYTVYKRLDLLNFWIYTYCATCLGCLLNPCISVWLGPEFCMSTSTVILLAVVFYLPGLNNVINIYKDACGLFKEVQYRALATAVVNLVVSIVLVLKIGVDGVFIGTIVAYLTTIYVVDPRVVYKKVFELPSNTYYIGLLKKFIIFVCIVAVSYYGISKVLITSWIALIIAFFVLSIVVNCVLLIIFGRTAEFSYLKGLAQTILVRILGKVGILKNNP